MPPSNPRAVRNALDVIHSADPTTSIGRGQLAFVARNGPTACRRAAEDILGRSQVAPARPDPYRSPIALHAWPEMQRPMTDDERQLVAAYAARRDRLTDAEAKRLATIYAHTEPGAGRDLIVDALEPTLAEIERAQEADEVAEARWQAQHRPKSRVRIDPEIRRNIEAELAGELAGELGEIPEVDRIAALKADDDLRERSKDAEAAWKERGAELAARAAGSAPTPPAAA